MVWYDFLKKLLTNDVSRETHIKILFLQRFN